MCEETLIGLGPTPETQRAPVLTIESVGKGGQYVARYGGTPQAELTAQGIVAAVRLGLQELVPKGEARRCRVKIRADHEEQPQTGPGVLLETELVEILHLVRSDRLDLTGSNSWGIDLSPARLDSLGVDVRRFGTTRGVNLAGVRLDECTLVLANLHGAVLLDASLRGTCLAGANLNEVRFTDTDLTGADLSLASFDGAVFFGANLRGASFHRANLAGAHLDDAQDLKGIDWHQANLDRTWIRRHQIQPIEGERAAIRGEGRYESAVEIFLNLKNNFLSTGNYEDAAWAYVKEQQMEKATFFPGSRGKKWILGRMRKEGRLKTEAVPTTGLVDRIRSAALHVRLFLGFAPMEAKFGLDRTRWLRNWTYELVTGYGERPQMPVLWGVVVIFLFGIIYALAGNVRTGDPASSPPTHSFLTALTHSISSFSTVGFNTLEPVGWGARLITSFESMLGIGLFALLVYTLGNRISRS